MPKWTKAEKKLTPEEVKIKLGDLYGLDEYEDFLHYLGDEVADRIDSHVDNSFEWEIKTHSMPNLPSWLAEKMSEDDVVAQGVNEIDMQLREDLVISYGDDIKEKYDWVDDWFQEGRSGGWFVIKPNVSLEALWDDIKSFQDFTTDDEDSDFFTDKQLDLRMKKVERIKKDLVSINNNVDAMMNEYEKLITSDKFWEEHLGKPDKTK